jgi:hypothetical protein
VLAGAGAALAIALVTGARFETPSRHWMGSQALPDRPGPTFPVNPAPDRFEAIGRLLAGPETPDRDSLCLRELAALGASAPAGTLDFIEARLKGDLRAQAVTALLIQWARSDPEGALGRACSGASKASEVGAVMTEIARNDPHTARILAEGLSSRDTEASSIAYPAAVQGMAESGAFEDARALIETSPGITGDARELMIEMLADQWGRSRPEEAAAWVLAIPDETSRNQALVALGTAWSGNDPEGAALFAVQLPPGAARQAVLGQAITRWASTDAQGAAEWLLQFPSDPDFDQAVARLATHPATVANNVDLALNWTETIVDPDLRFNTANAVLSELYARDPAAALGRLKDMKLLSDEERQALAAQLQGRP